MLNLGIKLHTATKPSCKKPEPSFEVRKVQFWPWIWAKKCYLVLYGIIPINYTLCLSAVEATHLTYYNGQLKITHTDIQEQSFFPLTHLKRVYFFPPTQRTVRTHANWVTSGA